MAAGKCVAAEQSAAIQAGRADPKKFQPLLPERPVAPAEVAAKLNAEDAIRQAGRKDAIALSILQAGRPESAPKIPPIYSGVVGSREKPLNEDTDAMRWAGEFMQAAQFIWERGEKIDKATMLAWFSNAIMCGFDESGRRYAKAADDAALEIDRLKKANATTWSVCEAEMREQNFKAVVWAILSFLAGVVATIGTLYGMAVWHQ